METLASIIGFIALVIMFLVLVFAVTAINAWIVMLVLGALSGPLGFTAPGYWVVFGVIYLLSVIGGILRKGA